MLMAGADVTMLVATLLRHGIGHIKGMEEELIQLAAGARIRIPRPTAGQYEPAPQPQPQRIRAGAVHAGHPVVSPDLEW
jgi:hypothetical protein